MKFVTFKVLKASYIISLVQLAFSKEAGHAIACRFLG